MKSKIFNGILYCLSILSIIILFVPLKAVAGIGLAGMFTFSSVDFNGEEVRDLADVIMEKTFNNPKINEFHTIIEGIVAGKQIIYSGLLSKITKADAGCGTGATSKAIPFTQKKWNPVPVKMWLQLCADELEGNLLVYAKKLGVKVKDLTDTQVIKFILENVSNAMLEDFFRILWFNDKAADNVAGGGNITDTVSLADYNMIDGFWKQIFAIAAATPARRVTITENAGVSYTAQDTWASATSVTDYFEKLITGSDYRLQGAPGQVILCTMSMFNRYAHELETATGVQAAYERIEGGFVTLKRRGITIIGWDFWDRTIRADFDNGTKWYNPHRALLTTKENLMGAIDDSAALNDLEVWYSMDDEINNARGSYKVDALVAIDYLLQVAY